MMILYRIRVELDVHSRYRCDAFLIVCFAHLQEYVIGGSQAGALRSSTCPCKESPALCNVPTSLSKQIYLPYSLYPADHSVSTEVRCLHRWAFRIPTLLLA